LKVTLIAAIGMSIIWHFVKMMSLQQRWEYYDLYLEQVVPKFIMSALNAFLLDGFVNFENKTYFSKK
jgi:hypothetical protein